MMFFLKNNAQRTNYKQSLKRLFSKITKQIGMPLINAKALQACPDANTNDRPTHGKEAATELWEENMKHSDFFHIL